MNDKLLLQECDHILWEGGYSYNVTEKLERIIAKVQDDVALMHAIELMEAIEQEHAKTIKACLAAVEKRKKARCGQRKTAQNALAWGNYADAEQAIRRLLDDH